jgi:hypothetical protein
LQQAKRDSTAFGRGYDAVMAPTFNSFLFSEQASHGDVKRLELKIGELASLFKGLQEKVDKKKPL